MLPEIVPLMQLDLMEFRDEAVRLDLQLAARPSPAAS
jgi:hypothetical protein